MSEKNIDFTIRQASAEDYPNIRNVVREAFATAEHTNGDEHNLVERLRKSESFVPELSLVAEANGVVIGHIMGTRARIGERTVLIPAPLSVLPDHQGEGIGTALAFRATEIAKELGFGAVVLVGDPRYERFGAQPASSYGITAPAGIADENFMAMELKRGGLDGVSGKVNYPKEFDMQ